MAEETKLKAGGRTVAISRPAKVMFPQAGLTKLDLARYFVRVAENMLPHLRGRPVVMQRFPDGIEAEGFYHKRAPDYFPPWVRTAEVPLAQGGEITHVVVDDTATLAYLADQGLVTPHAWLSRADKPHQPDQIIWDLDPPPGGEFAAVRQAARRLCGLLERVGLAPFVKLTGSKGLHVVCPIRRGPGFDQTRQFAQQAAEVLADRHPGDYTLAQRKGERQGRLFLDTLRNSLGQTAVAPYAPRPLTGAPVAAPLGRAELDRAELEPRAFTTANVFRRLGQKTDPWQGLHRHARTLDGPAQALAGLARGQS